jgi:hypothetical protein
MIGYASTFLLLIEGEMANCILLPLVASVVLGLALVLES